MTAPPRIAPPRVAYRLLRRVLPPGTASDSLLGDLHEEYVRMRSRPVRDLWYIGVALRLAAGRLLRGPFEGAWRDLLFATRLLRHRPAYTTVAVATLALGIGANTAIFSVINRALLAPLPFGAPDRLVAVWETIPSMQIFENTPAPSTLARWRATSRTAESFAAYTLGTANLTGVGDPERLTILRASADLLRVLNLPLALGRNFAADEDRYGGPRVVLLTDRLWTRRFARDPHILGRTFSSTGRPRWSPACSRPACRSASAMSTCGRRSRSGRPRTRRAGCCGSSRA